MNLKLLYILSFLLGIQFFPRATFAQEKEVLQSEVNQDNLGNVEDEFQQYFFEALKQKAIENPEKAIDALQKCIALKPEEAILYIELGKNHKTLKNYPLAEENFKIALQKRAGEKNRFVLSELFEVYFESQNYSEAIQTAQKLTRFDSGYYEDLANLYMMVKKPDQALLSLEKLDSLRGKTDYTENLRRKIFEATGDTKTQTAYLKNQISQNPENQENYLRLINLYGENGNFDEAFSWAKKLQEKYPESEKAHLALYQLYLNNQQYDKAIVSMKKVLAGTEIEETVKVKVLNDFVAFTKENPEYKDDLVGILNLAMKAGENSASNKELGDFYLEKDQQKALQHYTNALENNFNDVQTIERTLSLQLELGQDKAAVELAEKALTIFPLRPSLYLLLGSAQNNLASFPNALESLEIGLSYLIDNPKMEAKFYRQLVIAEKGLGNTEKAALYQNKANKTKTPSE
ncbi:MAG TPA: hypothetical protein VFM65_04715 [Flavobacteriaceae bacterium]|nr:hypothetical protein [Flavobacteriaceae bacterium]